MGNRQVSSDVQKKQWEAQTNTQKISDIDTKAGLLNMPFVNGYENTEYALTGRDTLGLVSEFEFNIT